ncbi:enoyl-CoA hydratase/isomerase family protein [Pseudonocardia lacus]|uniref:enoyl-CoA hydratase/isomerase family protein n=1 Tax=Pseudonocardia lacus TaxID=2835865 RepID=UPI0027E31AE2|nr:enoyl-CoA hydratase/isomerase family protein [Pseudonocardia lacus]
MKAADPQPPRTTPTELAAAPSTAVLDATGVVRRPVVLVDLDRPAPGDVVAAAADAAAAGDRVLVGVATAAPDPALAALVAALDVSVVASGSPDDRATVPVADPAAEAAALAAAVTANPGAALVLAGLLRTTGALPVPAALDAESLAYSTLLGGPEFRRWLTRRGPRPLPPPASTEPVLLDRHDDVLRLTLNRPGRRNAYGREVRDALVAALQLADLDDTVARVILTGAGPAFCAGGDLDEFGTAPDPVTAHFVRTRAGAARLLHRLRDRVEVRVHGACVGAGIELPAFAGRIVAAPDATFRLPEIAMGLIPGAGGTVSIPRRIGRWRTLHLALSGRALPAATARAWGLVDWTDRARAAQS